MRNHSTSHSLSPPIVFLVCGAVTGGREKGENRERLTRRETYDETIAREGGEVEGLIKKEEKVRSRTANLSFSFFVSLSVSLSPVHLRIGECPRSESGRQCLGRPPSGA